MNNIKDVAKHAGVAISTVSRVINNRDKVSDKTKAKVLNAMKALDFHPNMAAQNLKHKRTNTLGIIIEDISIPHSTAIIKGIDSAASKSNLNLFLCDGDSSRVKIINHAEVLIKRQVDGIIISSDVDMDEKLKKVLLKAISLGIPVVLISMQSKDLDVTTVMTSSAKQAETVLDYLIKLGHSRIALIASHEHSYVSKGNIDFYIKKMKELGTYDESLILYCDKNYDRSKGRYSDLILDKSAKCAIELMQMQNPPTAIYALGDLIMLGAMSGLKKINIESPENLSFIACCTPDFFTKTFIDLTYLSIPCFELGKTAAQSLISQINNKELSGRMDIILDSTLIEKNSCKRSN